MLQNQSIRLLFNDFVSLFFPNYCLSCNKTLTPSEKHICLHCSAAIHETDLIERQPNIIHERFFELPHLRYAFVYAWFQQGGVIQKLIHQLKYANEDSVATFIGERYGTKLRRYNYDQVIDMVTCVPLHYLKYRKRGYNQSELLARSLAESLGVPFKNLIKKKYHKTTQTKKKRVERFENTEHSFGLLSNYKLEGKNILVVDDVLTTGATLQAACMPLIEKAATVSVFTIAAVR